MPKLRNLSFYLQIVEIHKIHFHPKKLFIQIFPPFSIIQVMLQLMKNCMMQFPVFIECCLVKILSAFKYSQKRYIFTGTYSQLIKVTRSDREKYQTQKRMIQIFRKKINFHRHIQSINRGHEVRQRRISDSKKNNL